MIEPEPRGPQIGDRAGRRLLDRVGDAQQARRGGRRSRRRPPSGRRGAGRRPAPRAGRRQSPARSSIAGIADGDRSALDPALHAAARSATGTTVRRWNRQPALARRGGDRRGQRMLARSLEAGGQPQQLRLVLARRRPRSRRRCGFPSVSVPVLSKTSVSTRSRTSRASAFLTSTPAAAPRPVPTMIDIGVASPGRTGRR